MPSVADVSHRVRSSVVDVSHRVRPSVADVGQRPSVTDVSRSDAVSGRCGSVRRRQWQVWVGQTPSDCGGWGVICSTQELPAIAGV